MELAKTLMETDQSVVFVVGREGAPQEYRTEESGVNARLPLAVRILLSELIFEDVISFVHMCVFGNLYVYWYVCIGSFECLYASLSVYSTKCLTVCMHICVFTPSIFPERVHYAIEFLNQD